MNSFTAPDFEPVPEPELQRSLRVLREVSRLLRGLTATQLRELEAGTVRLGVVSTSGSDATRRSPKEAKSFEAIIEELQGLNDPADGLNLLISRKLSKRSLEHVSRRLDLPVHRSDTVDHLRNRIVESTIGFRSRSNAIQHGGEMN